MNTYLNQVLAADRTAQRIAEAETWRLRRAARFAARERRERELFTTLDTQLACADVEPAPVVRRRPRFLSALRPAAH